MNIRIRRISRKMLAKSPEAERARQAASIEAVEQERIAAQSEYDLATAKLKNKGIDEKFRDELIKLSKSSWNGRKASDAIVTAGSRLDKISTHEIANNHSYVVFDARHPRDPQRTVRTVVFGSHVYEQGHQEIGNVVIWRPQDIKKILSEQSADSSLDVEAVMPIIVMPEGSDGIAQWARERNADNAATITIAVRSVDQQYQARHADSPFQECAKVSDKYVNSASLL